MPEFEKAGYQGYWIPGQRLNAEHGLAIIVKRRYVFDPSEPTLVPSDETGPVLLTHEYTDADDPLGITVDYPLEVTVEKPRVDVMVRGTAFAPKGRPVEEFEVRVRIAGVLDQRLVIVGDRQATWVEPKWLTEKEKAKGELQQYLPPRFTKPAPLTKLPLSYVHAYGGKAWLVLDEENQAVAEEFQQEAKQEEARRERKKEIEEELAAEEEAAAAAAKKAAAGEPEIADDVAREKAAEVFKESGTSVLDADALAGLDEADDDASLEIASPYRLGRDLPERPPEPDQVEEAEQAEVPVPGDAADGEASPEGGFVEGTSVIDIEKLAGEDELAAELLEGEEARARRLKDRKGTLRSRATEFGDIELSDEDWIDDHRGLERAKKEKVEDDRPFVPYAANPAGKGYCVGPLKGSVDGVKLPNIEWPDARLTPEAFVTDLAELELNELPVVAGLGPYSPGWYPRARYVGVLPWDLDKAEEANRKASEEYDPDDPDDQKILEQLEKLQVPIMRPPWFQEANPRMIVDELRGDEEVMLENLTPEGTTFFRLPALHPMVSLDVGRGHSPIAMRLDTLTIDVDAPDKPAVELLWRGWYRLRDFSEMEEFTRIDVDIAQVDQEAWLDSKRDEAGGPKEGATSIFAAISDDEEEAPVVVGEEADARYRDRIAAATEAPPDAVGAPKEGATSIFKQFDERQLTDDDWDEEIRDDKEAWVDDALQRQDELKAARLKERRRKAREKVDAEFGIVREPPGGEGEGEA